jgi:hypothetical protein
MQTRPQKAAPWLMGYSKHVAVFKQKASQFHDFQATFHSSHQQQNIYKNINHCCLSKATIVETQASVVRLNLGKCLHGFLETNI